MTREIELPSGQCLIVEEANDLDNDAGAVVWDAALVLIHYLAACQQRGCCKVREKSVLELGSGVGAVGLAAAALGAKRVVLTDLPHLVPRITANITANMLGSTACALPLLWADGQQLQHALAECSGSNDAHPDILLASDVIYEASQLQNLFHAMAHACGSHTVVLLSIEDRPGMETSWMSIANNEGLSIAEVAFADLSEEWRSSDIHVYKLQRLSV